MSLLASWQQLISRGMLGGWEFIYSAPKIPAPSRVSASMTTDPTRSPVGLECAILAGIGAGLNGLCG